MERSGRPDRPTRIDIRKTGVVIDSEARSVNAVILDVSQSGFRAEVDGDLMVGEIIRFLVDRDEFSAQIRWSLGGEVGGVFLAQTGLS